MTLTFLVVIAFCTMLSSAVKVKRSDTTDDDVKHSVEPNNEAIYQSFKALFGNTEWIDRSGIFNEAVVQAANKFDVFNAFHIDTLNQNNSRGATTAYSVFAKDLPFAGFMNLGYAFSAASEAEPNFHVLKKSSESLKEFPFPVSQKYGKHLFHFMATDGLPTDLFRGSKVLEVGSGRGSGAAYIAQEFAPSQYVGMDLTPDNIKLARTYYGMQPNLKYVVGNSMEMPFRDQEFDIVLNVESSHNYPKFDQFVSEAHRVLKTGGYFLWTDILLKEGENLIQKKNIFESYGFRIEKRDDITERVLLGRDKAAQEMSRDELNRFATSVYANAVKRIPYNHWEFAALPGTYMYLNMQRGKAPYIRFIARKS